MVVKLKHSSEDSDIVARYKERRRELIDLTEEQTSRIKKRLKRELNDFEDNTSDLRTILSQWNDLMENIIEDVEPAFQGASTIHIPIVAIYAKVYHSVERRSILGSDNIWYAESSDEKVRDLLPDIEDGLNYKARTEWNIKESLSDVFWTTNRDALGIWQGDYILETENVEDTIYIVNQKHFLQEFSNPKDSGISTKEYQEWFEKAKTATEDDPLEIPIEEEVITYQGPRGEVVERADFVILPAHAQSLEKRHCRGFGKRFTLRRGEIKRKINDDEWYKEARKLLVKGSTGIEPTELERSKDFAAGINRGGSSDEHEFYELVYWFPLKNKEETKLVLTYNKDKDVLCAAKYYLLRRNNYVLFRIERKANQLDGGSVPGGLSELNGEIDEVHNQRNNSRKITEVPSFKAKKSLKQDFDTEDEDNRWRPGVIFWLDNPELFEQFKVQPVDFGTSLREEQVDMRYCTLLLGLDPNLFSGNAPIDDPDAPGNKTGMLINQSNLRMDDPLNELRPSVEEVGNVCMELEYKYGPTYLEFQRGSGKGAQTVRVAKRLFRQGLRLYMHGITVALNPDIEFQKWFNVYRALLQEPLIAKNSKRRIESLRLALRNGRVPGRNKILPTIEEIEKEDQEMLVGALQQIEQQKQQAQAQGQQDIEGQVANRVKQVDSQRALVVKAVEDRAKTIKSVRKLTEAIVGNGKK